VVPCLSGLRERRHRVKLGAPTGPRVQAWRTTVAFTPARLRRLFERLAVLGPHRHGVGLSVGEDCGSSGLTETGAGAPAGSVCGSSGLLPYPGGGLLHGPRGRHGPRQRVAVPGCIAEDGIALWLGLRCMGGRAAALVHATPLWGLNAVLYGRTDLVGRWVSGVGWCATVLGPYGGWAPSCSGSCLRGTTATGDLCLASS